MRDGLVDVYTILSRDAADVEELVVNCRFEQQSGNLVVYRFAVTEHAPIEAIELWVANLCAIGLRVVRISRRAVSRIKDRVIQQRIVRVLHKLGAVPLKGGPVEEQQGVSACKGRNYARYSTAPVNRIEVRIANEIVRQLSAVTIERTCHRNGAF